MAKTLSAQQISRLARIGAAARLVELQEEIAMLRRAFPGLRPAVEGPAAPEEGKAPKPTRKSRRRRRAMTAAEKKAASERMKRVWAERRKSKA